MEKSIRSILMVSAQYLPHVGGVENYVANLSRELVARGHRVTVLTSEAEGAPQREDKDGIEVIRLPSHLFMSGRFPVLKHGRVLREVKRELMSRSFDIMLVNARFYFISLWALKLAKRMKLRAVLLDHGTSHLNTGGKLTSRLGEIFEHYITWREKHYCREFAGVSVPVTKWLGHFKIDTDTVLYNAVNSDKTLEYIASPSRDIRRDFNIPEGAPVLAFVGRLTLEKGVLELSEAMKLISEKRPDAHLIVVGDGYLRERLENEKCENTHFTGVLSQRDTAAVLAAADIFIFPSFSEGFSTVLLEASLAENYIIATEGAVAREFIKDERYATLIPAPDAALFADAAISALDDAEKRSEGAALCKAAVLENFTWRHTADAFINLINMKD